MLAMTLVVVLTGCTAGGDKAPSPASVATPVTVTAHLAAATADSLQLVWRFQLQDQWYLYGPFRNDTGFAPSVTLSLPDGWTAGPLHFPPPTRKVLPGDILDHVYQEELLLTQTVHLGVANDRPAELAATVNWLVCKDLCVPGQAALTVAIDRPTDEGTRLLARAEASRPRPLAPDVYRTERGTNSIALTVPGAARLVFIPSEDAPLFEDLLADGKADGEVLNLRLRPATMALTPFSGLLSIHYKNGDMIVGTLMLP